MSHTRLSLAHFILALSIIIGFNGTVRASPQAITDLYVYPLEGAPGAVLHLTSLNQSPGSTYQIYILGNGAPEILSLGSFVAGRDGTVTGTAILPTIPSGQATINIDSIDNPAITTFTVLPAPALTLDPLSGPPGTVLTYTVTNLVAGSLRLDYDGVPVLGPLPVGAGTKTGSFTVPRNRPAVLGDPVEVDAYNLAGGNTVGVASATFTSQPIPAPTVYHFSAVNLPTSPVLPGQLFQITGQISPPPAGPSTQYSLKVLWKTGAGQIFPITSGTSTLQSDGSFQVSAIMPSLLNGDPMPAEQDGKVGVVLFSNQNISPLMSGLSLFGIYPNPPAFRIKVQDPNGNPIPNVIVDLRGALADLAGQIYGAKPDGSVVSLNSAELASQPNQLLAYGNGTIFPTEKDPFNCAPSPVYGRTDANGIFQPNLPLNDWLALAGKKVSLGPSYPGAYLVNPTEVTFSVNISGQYQGYGQVNNKVPVPWTMDIRYIAAAGSFFQDLNGQHIPLDTNPLVVTLQPLPPDTPLEQPIELKVPGATPLAKIANWLGTGAPLTAFGKFVGFPSLTDYPDAIFLNPPQGLVVAFDQDAALYGELDQSNLTLTINNNTYPFQAITTSQCGNASNLTYRATIPHYHRLAPGNYVGLVQVKDMATPPNITKRYIQINVVAPPDWFHDQSLQNRSVFYNSTFSVELQGDILAPGNPTNTSSLDATLNKVGPVSNSAGARGTYVQWFTTSGAGQRKFQGSINYGAMNSPGSQDVSQPATTNTPITFHDGPITILNTGKFPLFRDTWGIPPIAGATIGADMWFKATLTYSGTIQTKGLGGGTSYTIKVDPEATVGVDAWLDISALMGIVKAEGHAIPSISMSLPATFQNGTKIDTKKCFKYKLDIGWSASVGYCPFCLSDSGTENIFLGHVPNSSYCSNPAVTMKPADITPPMPDASPSLAVDGVGGVLAVWRADDGTLQYSRYTGLKWQTPAVLSTNQSSGSPVVAYYAPGKAVAVWTQNALTPQQSQTASFATRVLNQHLVYAVWNGTAWSAPLNLTPATTGEGAIALAGCLSTNAACPAGGSVAAVWVRDIAGDLSQHKLRLFYATFQNGLWSSTLEVDPGSPISAMDSEPTLAYQNSTPVVAWVRDADGDLGTLADRRIAYRGLGGGGSVTVPVDLPAGAVEPSLAIQAGGNLRLAFTVATDASGLTGNQRQLYSAAQSCSGSCTWVVQPLVDWHGRVIHAEGPKLTIDSSGQGTILYRGLGMGPLPGGGYAVFKEDAPGIIQGTGEVSKVLVNFASVATSPQYLTQDGLNKWQVSSVYDPLTQQTFITAAIAGGGLLSMSRAAPQAIAQNEPVIAFSTPDLPDYAVDSVTPSAIFVLPSTSLSVDVGVINSGSNVSQGLTVEAAWDGPPGTGLPAGTATLVAPAAGQLAQTTLLIDTSGVNLGLPHQLYIAINPDQSLPEAGFENNSAVVQIGGLTPPSGLTAAARTGSSLVFLSWTAPRDPRIVGFHVYRFEAGGPALPVGSSFEPDFADLLASLDAHYQYAVTSFDAEGEESALSNQVEVDPVSLNNYLPLIQGP